MEYFEIGGLVIRAPIRTATHFEPSTHFQPVGYWNGRREKMLDPGSRCLMPSLVSSQFALHCRLIARFAAIRTICLSLLVGAGAAQNTEPAQTQGQQSGTSTGIAHAPVKDALSRPITAGAAVWARAARLST